MLAMPGTPSIAKHEANASTLSPGSECCPSDRNPILKAKETQRGTPGHDSGAAAQETQGKGHARWAWAWYVWLWSSHGLRALSWTCPDSHCPLLPPSQCSGEASALSTPQGSCPSAPPAQEPQETGADRLSSSQSQHWEEMFIFFSKLPQLLCGG